MSHNTSPHTEELEEPIPSIFSVCALCNKAQFAEVSFPISDHLQPEPSATAPITYTTAPATTDPELGQ